MRITTNMLRKNYMSGLSATLQDMTDKRNTVMTGRKYNRFSENPFDASSAATLERKYLRNKDYLETIKELQSMQDTQFDAASEISDIAETISKEYSVSAMNDVSGQEGRASYAVIMRELQEEMVSSLNAQYSDRFVFAGSDAQNAPFELSEDGKTLLYRGVDVNSDDPADQARLKELAEDKVYADIGFGLSWENDEVVSSTAFNYSMPGINLVGYGKTEDGTTKNMVLLVGQMADELEKDTFDAQAYEKLWDQFQEGANDLIDMNGQISIRSKSLETTKTRLSDMDLTMTEQLDSLENEDPAYSIMNYSYSQYTYNCALKIGTSIIGQSLLDFLN